MKKAYLTAAFLLSAFAMNCSGTARFVRDADKDDLEAGLVQAVDKCDRTYLRAKQKLESCDDLDVVQRRTTSLEIDRTKCETKAKKKFARMFQRQSLVPAENSALFLERPTPSDNLPMSP